MAEVATEQRNVDLDAEGLDRGVGFLGLLWASEGSIIGSGWLFGALVCGHDRGTVGAGRLDHRVADHHPPGVGARRARRDCSRSAAAPAASRTTRSAASPAPRSAGRPTSRRRRWRRSRSSPRSSTCQRPTGRTNFYKSNGTAEREAASSPRSILMVVLRGGQPDRHPLAGARQQRDHQLEGAHPGAHDHRPAGRALPQRQLHRRRRLLRPRRRGQEHPDLDPGRRDRVRSAGVRTGGAARRREPRTRSATCRAR